jgi:hypothetical protein
MFGKRFRDFVPLPGDEESTAARPWNVLPRFRGLPVAGFSPAALASAAVDALNLPKLLPNTKMLQQVLEEYGLRSFVDDDGDLTVRWEECSMYFFQYGPKREVLQARMYLNRRFPVEARAGVAMVLDDWNRTKLFPKAYTVLPDDGLVGICGEQSFDFEAGVTKEQLKYTVGVWIDTLLRFAEWVQQQVYITDGE